jgi:hypothetical protein
MSVLVRDGRAALADALRSKVIHLAWGRGDPNWNTSKSVLRTFDSDDIVTTGYGYISNPVVKSSDELTTYTEGTDYTLDLAGVSGKIVRKTDGLIGANEQVLVTVDLGRPPEPINGSSLIDEVGRRLLHSANFCTPSLNGDIIVPNGRYELSLEPTNHLHVSFKYDFPDGAGEIIRELGVFINTEVEAGLPIGQKYYDADQIADQGIMMLLEYINPLSRDNATRETFEFVITL